MRWESAKAESTLLSCTRGCNGRVGKNIRQPPRYYANYDGSYLDFSMIAKSVMAKKKMKAQKANRQKRGRRLRGNRD